MLQVPLPAGKPCLAADILPSLWGAPQQREHDDVLSSLESPSCCVPSADTGLTVAQGYCPSRLAVPRCSVFQDDSSQKADGDVLDAVPEAQETVHVIPGSKLLWRVNTRPPNSAQVRLPPAMPATHPPQV